MCKLGVTNCGKWKFGAKKYGKWKSKDVNTPHIWGEINKTIIDNPLYFQLTQVHNEIHDAIGPDHVVRWEDRGKLPYTEAVIAEVMRRSNVIPLVAPHATLEDVTFRGYHIPKGTMVLINGYSVDMDPRIWNDPSKFNPSRFIDVNGQYCRKEEQFTFGMGMLSVVWSLCLYLTMHSLAGDLYNNIDVIHRFFWIKSILRYRNFWASR